MLFCCLCVGQSCMCVDDFGKLFSIQAMDHNLHTALFAHMPVFGCSDGNLFEHHCRCVINFYAKHMS